MSFHFKNIRIHWYGYYVKKQEVTEKNMKKQNRYLHRARAVSSTLVIRISEKCMLRTQSDIKPHSKKYLQNMYNEKL